MDRRRFVRHPIRVPVSVRLGGGDAVLTRSGDVSEGGLSFELATPVALQSAVEVELPVHGQRFRLTGTVASCVGCEGGFRVGLCFLAPDVQFKMKLAEQVLRIEELRQTLSLERGLEVTRAEAAALWVEKYASTFADLYPHR